VASLAGVARDRTDLDDADVAHLRALLADASLVADLAFSDLVLWLPTWNDGGFVAGGQVRPSTAPTAVPDDLVGRFVPRGRRPVLDRALLLRRPVLDRDAARPLLPRGEEAVPVLRRGRVIGVVSRHSAGARADGARAGVPRLADDLLAGGRGHLPGRGQRGGDHGCPAAGG
jgi:hypothetical protein